VVGVRYKARKVASTAFQKARTWNEPEASKNIFKKRE